MAYLLDANVFIAARQLHYGFDFCPAFWDWLIHAHRIGLVFSIDRVAGEIQAGEGDLSDWAGELDDGFFIEPDEQVLPALGSVSAWATDHRFPNGQSYTQAAVNTFLQVADYYLVAQALAGSHIVVTHEKVANSIGNVKIPNACLGVGVRYMTPFEMLRRERARFVLGC
ncbi:MAG: DUF4411 family protein [Phycisphaerales bacterium JB065]